MRPLTAALAALLLLVGCGSTGDSMTMTEARDQVRQVVEDLAVALGGPITVSQEYVNPAAATQAEGDDELIYSLSLDVAVTPDTARQVVEDDLADRYREQGWNVEVGHRPDVPLRLTRDGALVAIRSGPDRDGALVTGTSAPVPTPDGVRPAAAGLPFPAYQPPS